MNARRTDAGTPFAAEIKWRWVGLFGKLLVDGLFATTRIECVNDDRVQALLRSRHFILAFWHSRILLVSFLYQGWGGLILVSRSKDGEFIARVVERQGHTTVRGSTTRGGRQALVQMIRRLKTETRPGVIIPDGPQGPRFQVQPGIIALAKKTGLPIIPVTYSARRAKIFDSWDRFMLPYPFTDCRVVYGTPVCVASGCDRNAEERSRSFLEHELRRITRAADRYFGHPAF